MTGLDNSANNENKRRSRNGNSRGSGGGNGNRNATVGWERTIATHHSIVSLVLEARGWLPDAAGGYVWFAPHAAHTSAYAPFPCGLLRLPEEGAPALPDSYALPSGWDDVNKSRRAAWVNRAVFALAQVVAVDKRGGSLALAFYVYDCLPPFI